MRVRLPGESSRNKKQGEDIGRNNKNGKVTFSLSLFFGS